MTSTIKAGIYFPPCPVGKSRKVIKAWEKERAEFDTYIEQVNNEMAACDNATDAMIEDLFSNAELAMLNLKGSFNFHVKRLMPSYQLSERVKQLIFNLMRCKYFQLKDVHIIIMGMKHDAIAAKQVKEIDAVLEKLPQWRLEDGADGEKNKWWVKRNRAKDNKTVLVSKIMRGLELKTEKFVRISATFDCKTGVQIDTEQFITAVNIMDLY